MVAIVFFPDPKKTKAKAKAKKPAKNTEVEGKTRILLTPEEFMVELRTQVDKVGGIAVWAERNGFEYETVRVVVNGNRAPSPGIAKAAGYSIEKSFREIS